MQQELEFIPEDGAVNRIKSLYKTLDNYRRTSVVAHHRVVPAVYSYASSAEIQVGAMLEEFPRSERVQRWADKFYDYLDTYKLRDV